MEAVRHTTIKRLLQTKTVGFLGGVALLSNALSGPGLPFVPQLFSSAGYVIPTLLFVLFSTLSALSVLFIVEAMQAIPGNRHFQGTVEYGTLINFYFGSWMHVVGQFFLYAALQSQAIQSIVICSQTIDSILIEAAKLTCGVGYQASGLVWKCAKDLPKDSGSPFDIPMILTIGFGVMILLTIPLSFLNLDDNVGMQIVSFIIMFGLVLEWIVASFFSEKATLSNLSAAPPSISGLTSISGLVIQNCAFAIFVPSWVNLKKKSVNVQGTVWLATSITMSLYVLFGIAGAYGFKEIQGDTLTLLRNSGPLAIKVFSKVTTYTFSLLMLLPAVPVYFIVAKDNLIQNQLASPRIAFIVSYLLPWIVCIPLIAYSEVQLAFINWTSLVFVSASNFVIPILIYLQCLKFRKAYNQDRELSVKQKLLLKSIHWSSKSIHKFIDLYNIHHTEDKLDIPPNSPVDRTKRSSVSPSVEFDSEKRKSKDTSIEFNSSERPKVRSSLVPSIEVNSGILSKRSSTVPSIEERPATPEVDNATSSQELKPTASNKRVTIMDPIPSSSSLTLLDDEPKRLKPRLSMRVTVQYTDTPNQEEIHQTDSGTTIIRSRSTRRSYAPNSPLAGAPLDLEMHGTASDSEEHHQPAWIRTSKSLPARIHSVNSNKRISAISVNHQELITEGEAAALEALLDQDVPDPEQEALTDIPLSSLHAHSQNPEIITTDELGNERIIRRQTLPFHPQFISPAFRSIPKWVPFKALNVARVCLAVLSVIMVLNIVLALAFSSREKIYVVDSSNAPVTASGADFKIKAVDEWSGSKEGVGWIMVPGQ